MNKVYDALYENLQIIYRKAVDADNYLEQAQKQGNGKFVAIFPEDTIFKISSKRFLPYVQEVADEIEQFKQSDDSQAQERLPSIVKKLELLLATLVEFKQQL